MLNGLVVVHGVLCGSVRPWAEDARQ
jgi:hypothetical protein